MRLLRQLLAGPLMLFMTVSAPAFAQERHAVDPAALAAAVSQHAASQDADRTAIREALSRPEVRDIATHMGMDLDRVSASVGTLAGADLERVAGAARQVNQSLVGGASTVVISTTTIIVVLLVLILLIIALK